MRIIVVAMSALVLAGCQAVQGYPPPGMTPKEALDSVSAAASVARETDYGKAEGAARQQLRDSIVRSRIYVADVNYHEFARSLSTEQKAFAVGSDLTVLALAGAGTLAKSTKTKTRLASWSAGVLGGRSAIDKEIYYDKTLPAIIAQMDASRRTVLATLYTGLAKSDGDYSLLQAKTDLEDYYIAGTLPGALNAITKEAGKQTGVADLKIEKISEAKYNYTDVSKRIRDYWKPGDAVDSAHAKALDDWLGKNAGGVSIAYFINGGGTAAQQSALISALSIP